MANNTFERMGLTSRPGGSDIFVIDEQFLGVEDATAGNIGTLAITHSNSGSLATQDVTGGAVLIQPSDSTAADNDESYIHTAQKVFLFAADKPAYFCAEVKGTEANTDDMNIIAGFSSAAVANTALDDGAGPPASYSGAVFYKLDGGTTWNCESSNAGTQVTTTGIKTFTTATYYKLEIMFEPVNATVGKVHFYIDGALLASHDITLASLANMYAIIGVKNGSANNESLYVKSVYAYGKK